MSRRHRIAATWSPPLHWASGIRQPYPNLTGPADSVLGPVRVMLCNTITLQDERPTTIAAYLGRSPQQTRPRSSCAAPMARLWMASWPRKDASWFRWATPATCAVFAQRGCDATRAGFVSLVSTTRPRCRRGAARTIPPGRMTNVRIRIAMHGSDRRTRELLFVVTTSDHPDATFQGARDDVARCACSPETPPRPPWFDRSGEGVGRPHQRIGVLGLQRRMARCRGDHQFRLRPGLVQVPAFWTGQTTS